MVGRTQLMNPEMVHEELAVVLRGGVFLELCVPSSRADAVTVFQSLASSSRGMRG